MYLHCFCLALNCLGGLREQGQVFFDISRPFRRLQEQRAWPVAWALCSFYCLLPEVRGREESGVGKLSQALRLATPPTWLAPVPQSHGRDLRVLCSLTPHLSPKTFREYVSPQTYSYSFKILRVFVQWGNFRHSLPDNTSHSQRWYLCERDLASKCEDIYISGKRFSVLK